MTKKIFYVYQYYDPIRNEPIYIGEGHGNRAYEHLRPCRLKKNTPFVKRIKWILKQGEIPIVTIIKDKLTKIQALNLEGVLERSIGRKNKGKGPLLNILCGGERNGCLGYKWTKTQRKNLSKKVSGVNHPMYGKVGHFKDKKHSEETKNKISKSNLNKIISKEHRDKISNTLAKNWKIIFPNGEEKIIKNLKKFCRDNKLTDSIMVYVAKGKYKQHKGFKCEYV